jgi:hypothetical protein
MVALMNSPALIRSVAIVGNLHHGKTLFTDFLIQQTHDKRWAPEKEVRPHRALLQELSVCLLACLPAVVAVVVCCCCCCCC